MALTQKKYGTLYFYSNSEPVLHLYSTRVQGDLEYREGLNVDYDPLTLLCFNGLQYFQLRASSNVNFLINATLSKFLCCWSTFFIAPSF